MEEKILKLDEVIVDNDLNPRQGALDQDAVLDYSAHVDDLPPMHCFDIQGFYYLTRGFHRYAAHRLAMRTEARFVVHQGSREEAKEDADLDNLKHGLRLTRAERRKVIERQLRRHADWSDARLAGCCSTTDKTIRVVREELEANLVIPRFDVLKGADGIERPRTISRPAAPTPEPDGRQATLESAVVAPTFIADRVRGGNSFGDVAGFAAAVLGSEAPAVDPALLKSVEELETEAALAHPDSSTPLLDHVKQDFDEETSEILMDTPEVYEAIGQELVTAGLAEDDDAGEDLPDETQQEERDDDSSEAAQAVPSQPQSPVRPVEASLITPLPDPQPPASIPQTLPPLPPPVVREAAWVVSISWRPGAPALITILHGATPEQWLPADAAELCAALQARIKPVEPVTVTSDGDGREWLEA